MIAFLLSAFDYSATLRVALEGHRYAASAACGLREITRIYEAPSGRADNVIVRRETRDVKSRYGNANLRSATLVSKLPFSLTQLAGVSSPGSGYRRHGGWFSTNYV